MGTNGGSLFAENERCFLQSPALTSFKANVTFLSYTTFSLLYSVDQLFFPCMAACTRSCDQLRT
jgi:hypothetical protein